MSGGSFQLNPDSPILEQLKNDWDKIASLLVNKYGPPEGCVITMEDMMNFPRDKYMLVYGHVDAIQLKMVTLAEAKVIIEHEAGRKGSA